MKRLTQFVIFSVLTFCSGCKFRLVENSFPSPYKSIAESKRAKFFIYEYKPLFPYFKLGGKDYIIKEAWLENPHTSGHFTDRPTKDSCFVVTFTNIDKFDSTTDLHNYVKEMGNGNDKIWFNLPWDDNKKDTIYVYYRETLTSQKKDKIFLFFKKLY